MRQRPPAPSALATAVAKWGLLGAGSLPSTPLDDATFDALRAESERHRLIGLLAAAVEAGGFAVTDTQLDGLRAQTRRWHAVELRGEQLLLRALDQLQVAGIEHRVLKGPALARLAYEHPEHRTFGDVDVLVGAHDFHRCAELLGGALGAVRVHAEEAAGFDDEFGREIMLQLGSLELDLHRTLVSGYYGLALPLDELFDGVSTVTIGGRHVPALAPVPLLLHAALVAVIGDVRPRLNAQRDLVQLVRTSEVDECTVIAAAARWRCTDLLVAGLVGVADWCPAPVPPLVAWAQRQRVPLPRRVLQAAYRNRFRGPLVSLSGALAPLAPGARRRYVGATLRRFGRTLRSA